MKAQVGARQEPEAGVVQILNINMQNWTLSELLPNLVSGVVFTPNIDHLVQLQKDQTFYESYNIADYVVCDSRLIQLMSYLIPGCPAINEQIAGSDLIPSFCYYHRNNPAIKVFLLGGTPDSVELARTAINSRTASQIVIGGYSPPFGFEDSEAETEKIFGLLNESGANVLVVGVGAPKQENWIATHRHSLSQIQIFFGVGATIEYEAGTLSRAPRWMRKFGLEWFFRFCKEPVRLFRRYFVRDVRFLGLMCKQVAGRYRDPFAATQKPVCRPVSEK